MSDKEESSAGSGGTPEGRSKTSPPTTTAQQGARPLLASTKRPLMTHSKDGKLLSEKKLRRLEKNRLSARECRRRKREATENLERQINVLEGENLRLRLQLQIGEEAEDKMNKEQEKVTEGIVDLLESGASEGEIYANIEEFKEKFADYGRDRRSAIEFHLRNIERLLMPTQTTTIAMRALQGTTQQVAGGTTTAAATATNNLQSSENLETLDDGEQKEESNTQQQQPSEDGPTHQDARLAEVESVASAPAIATTTTTAATATVGKPVPPSTQDPKALFHYLVNHLEVSPEQAAALKDSRFVAQEMDGHLEKALGVLEELKSRLTKCGEDLEAEFDNVRSILTPTQAAKFLIWVANNGACMHMLNELWSRAYGLSTDPLDAVVSPESPEEEKASS